MKKVFFIDIDETLLPLGDVGISKENELAVKQLNTQYDVYIATGKSYPMAKAVLSFLNIDKCITSNGSYIQEQGKTIYSRPFLAEDIELVKKIVKQTEQLVLGGQGNSGSYILVNNLETDLAYIEKIFTNLTVEIPKFVPDFPEDIYQLWLFGELDQIEFQHEKFDTFRWHQYGMDIVYKNTSKAQAINYLLKTKYKDEEIKTYAFGDSLNDISMFELVDESIAMSTGHPDLIAKGKYLSDNTKNQGIYNYLNKEKIIK